MFRSTLRAAIVCLVFQASSPAFGASNLDIAHINLRTATSDYATVLNQLVIDVGRSEHMHVSRRYGTTGSRFVRKATKSSWIEGNRLSFEEIDDQEAELIRLIRGDMIEAAKQLPVNELHPDAKLAFWLNLHNLTVIGYVSDAYPVADIDEVLFNPNFRSSPESESEGVALYDQKFTVIDGRHWSLADIEKHIFTNWQDPLVMYGLFYGAIGSPNIRTRPYNAETVWKDLQENASEFVNSIRGIQTWGNRLAISRHYARAAILFPHFDRDVKAHLLSLIERPYWHRKITEANTIDPSVDNWRVADFFDGRPHAVSTSFAKSYSAGGNALVALQNMPLYTQRLAMNIARRNSRRTPTVRIEELEP